MPDITLTIFDHVVFLVLVALLPWNARRRFKALEKASEDGDPTARTRAYRTVVVQKWAFVAVIAVAWIALSRSAASIGLVASVSPLAISGYALAAVLIGAQLSLARSAVHTDVGRAKTRESIEAVRAFVPHTPAEKRWFDAMSFTAGIEEELVYRAFLFAYLAAWLPAAPAAIIIVLAALVFGLGHSYQGAAGIIKTGIVGVLLGIVFWMTGSVWAPIVLHIAIDLISGWISQEVVQDAGLDDRSEPVAA